MNKVFFSILFAAMFMFAGAGIARAEVTVVRAEGSAMMAERESVAKSEAFEDALKSAVVDAVAELLSGEQDTERLSEGLDRDVFSSPMKYVRNYKVLAEGWVTHYDLPQAGSELAPGVEPVEPQEVEGMDEQDGAPELHPADPVNFAEFYHIWIEASVDVGQLKNYLKQVTTLTEKSVFSANVVVLDFVDYETFALLKKRIETMSMVKDVSYYSFSRGKFVLKADITGTGYAFYESLVRKFSSEFAILPSGLEGVIIKAGRVGMAGAETEL